MVHCSCGKAIEKIPDWMRDIKVDFVCKNCPNRQTKNIAFIDLDSGLHASAKIDEPTEELVIDEPEEAEAE